MLFNKADINNVVTFLSVASETPIVSDSDLKGTVTIVSMKSIPLSLAYQVVNSALRARGYTMIGTLDSDIIRVVPLKKAVSEKQSVESGTKVDALVPNDDLVTQIIPLQFVSATRLKDDLKPLVSDDQASILAISDTNSLIVTDTAGNIRRLLQIINNLDQDTTDVVEVQIYTCQNASADNLVDTLTKTLLPKATSA